MLSAQPELDISMELTKPQRAPRKRTAGIYKLMDGEEESCEMLTSGCDVAAAPINSGWLLCQHKGMPTTSVGIPAASTDCTRWEGGQEQQLSS